MKKRLRLDKRKNNLLKWKGSMRILLAGLAGISVDVYADTPIGIIGGQDNASNAYAALVLQSGTLAPIAGLPASSVINSVAINQSEFSLIGGQNQNTGTAYAATISSNGTLNPLSLSITGIINAVAVNQGSTGLMGGQDYSLDSGYAAFIMPDGTITPSSGFADITANTASTLTAAINDMSVGLVGGEGDNAQPYAAYLALDGTVTEIPLQSMTSYAGQISTAALNAQGNGIIGGYFLGNAAYAAFVTPAAGPPIALSPLPMGGGGINSVAINDMGIGLIGGYDNAGNAYAGYSTPDGVVTPLFGSPFTGGINSVAMNASGAGIIGGQNGSDLYAALVQQDGTVTSVITDSIGGQINWVAINDPGIGLIGGLNTDDSDAYVALVAPNGTLTVLDADSVATISSVAIAGTSSILNAAIPQSIGPYLSVAYTQLAAIYALETRFLGFNNTGTQTGGSEIALQTWNADELLASNETCFIPRPETYCRKQPRPKPFCEPVEVFCEKNSIWFAPFGNYVFLQDQGKIPSYNNQIAGALLGYDHQASNYLVGACLGYAFNYVSYGKEQGHGKVQEEMVSFYGSYLREHFRLNGALWGGFYQFWNTRHTLSLITSKSKTHGWILSPHLEMASPWAIDQDKYYLVEPFFTLDWINSWQHRFTESGKAGFNLKVGNLYSSLLQSEVGLRFYETFPYGWGDFCLLEKVSYVNQAPFHVNSVTTSFVGSASSFPIAVASNKVENLGALELIASFIPKNTAYPYGGIAFQAMANGSYQSYFASLFLGIDF